MAEGRPPRLWRAPEGGAAEPDLSGVHVLVVEDDPDSNDLVCAILEDFGARVTSVATAEAALEVLARERPALVLSDIGLPDMDGTTLVRAVRMRAEHDAIPAVALTAFASRRDAERALAAGFDAHVAKPIDPPALGLLLLRLVARTGAAVGEPRAAGDERPLPRR